MAAVHEGDRGRELGEEGGLLDGGVAPAHHGDVLVAEEEAVARGARGDAVAEKLRFAGDIEHQRPGAGGHDHGLGPVGGLGRVGITGPDGERRGGEVDLGGLHRHELGTEPGRLRPHVGHQLRAHDAVGEPRVVLDLGGEHQLTTRLVAGRGQFALEHHRGQVGAGGVDGGGEPGGSRADDHHVVDVGRHDFLLVGARNRRGGVVIPVSARARPRRGAAFARGGSRRGRRRRRRWRGPPRCSPRRTRRRAGTRR